MYRSVSFTGQRKVNSDCCRASFEIPFLVRSSVAILGALSNGMTEEEAGHGIFCLKLLEI